MRILLLNNETIMAHALPWGFRQLGHDVKIAGIIQVDYLRRYLEVFKPDLLITAGWINEYTPEKLTMIKKAAQDVHCLHAYWAVEDIIHLEKWSIPMVKIVQPDLVFTINADCIPYYHALGIPAFHMEFGYNPLMETHPSKRPDADYNHEHHDLALVANSYQIWKQEIYRYRSLEILLLPLLERGYNLAIYGRRWEDTPWWDDKLISAVHCKGPVTFEESFRVFQSAKIILNPQNQSGSNTGVTSRTFEISGCGAFQLTVRTPAVENLFTHGKHLIMSNSPDETLKLVDYYLKHKKERVKIASQGQAEVLAKHTYDQRAAQMLECLNSIKAIGKPILWPEKNLSLKLLQPPDVDTSVRSKKNPDQTPSQNFAQTPYLYVGLQGNDPQERELYRTYLYFDSEALLPDGELDSAFLHLWLNWKGQADDVVGCFPVLEPWEKEKMGWMTQPSLGEQPVAVKEIEGEAQSRWLSWEITPLVKQWLNKTLPNHGICLRSCDENKTAATIMTMASSYWTGSKSYKPYLAILYY
jgi:spore maturation protein CgeB